MQSVIYHEEACPEPCKSCTDDVLGCPIPAHTIPCEAGGITMIELVFSMKSDAAAQTNLIGIFLEMLDETVERNDNLQVL